MGDEEALAADRAKRRRREVLVHELATCWSVMTNSLHVLRNAVADPELLRILDDMAQADARGHKAFEALRPLL